MQDCNVKARNVQASGTVYKIIKSFSILYSWQESGLPKSRRFFSSNSLIATGQQGTAK